MKAREVLFYKIREWAMTDDEKFRKTFLRHSFSQCGEDMIVDYVFRLRGISFPTFIDVGANHPFYLNNTAYFYLRGCRGVNVDANPNLIRLFEHYRPLDKNINVGVHSERGFMDFYLMEDDTLSTFSKAECDSLVATGKKLTERRKVNLIPPEELIAEYCKGQFPDFFSLDVEGLDFEILRAIDWKKSWPKVICVEAAEYSPNGSGKRRSELIAFLEEVGYYEYANTNLNAILVKNEFWFV